MTREINLFGIIGKKYNVEYGNGSGGGDNDDGCIFFPSFFFELDRTCYVQFDIVLPLFVIPNANANAKLFLEFLLFGTSLKTLTMATHKGYSI